MAGHVSQRFGLAAGIVFTLAPLASSMAGQDLLYGPAAQENELSVACFARRYDKAHLSAHPHQNVTRFVALAYRLRDASASESVFNMTVRFRAGAAEQQFPGVCQSGSGGLTCNVECDGGAFSVTVKDQTSVLVDLGQGIGTCDGDLPAGQGFGADDKVFRLDRADMSVCRDLVWDDDVRSAILAKGGLNP